jgi:hypothetical protein
LTVATVVVEDGFRVRVFGPPREHAPVHVHVEHGKEGLVVIRLSTRTRPQEIWAVYGMKNRDVFRAYQLVEKHELSIREEWRRLHG